MSAIARYCRHTGLNVSGYDRTPSHVTEALEKEGIPVHFDSNVSLIPPVPEETLVIYTPAVPSDMAEMVYVREHGYRIVKRAEALGEITSGKRCLAVSGTHGKTTTSTMLAHILATSSWLRPMNSTARSCTCIRKLPWSHPWTPTIWISIPTSRTCGVPSYSSDSRPTDIW